MKATVFLLLTLVFCACAESLSYSSQAAVQERMEKNAGRMSTARDSLSTAHSKMSTATQKNTAHQQADMGEKINGYHEILEKKILRMLAYQTIDLDNLSYN